MNDAFKELVVVKRTGQRVNFNGTKIAIAIGKGFDSVYENAEAKDINKVYELVLKTIDSNYKTRKTINVEDIQNIIEESLRILGYNEVYDSFSKYRLRRARSRDVFGIKPQHKFVKAIEKVGYFANEANNQKPNELIDSFAKIISKEFAISYLIEGKVEKAIEEGTIALNGIESYAIADTSSSHLNIDFENAKTIDDFFNEVIRTIILVKKDQFGEHTLINFDTILSTRVVNDFKNIFADEFLNNLKINGLDDFVDQTKINGYLKKLNEINDKFLDNELKNNVLRNIFVITYEKVLHKLNKLLESNFKRLFSILESVLSQNEKIVISLDNNDSFVSNIIIKNYFNSIISNKILTNIFVNDNDEINMILFEKMKSIEIHMIFEKNHDINYFSDGICVYENINGTNTSKGRVINSISTINLARIALKNKTIKGFLEDLESIIELNKNALIQRFDLQGSKTKENYNILFNKGLLYDSEKLEDGQKVRKVLRNGAFVMGFVGLIEASLILNKKEDNNLTLEDFELALKIVKAINKKCDQLTFENRLNFISAEIYDEDISSNFIRLDKCVFGTLKLINKSKYEPVYKFINNSKISFEEKLNMYSLYQNKTSSIYKIDLKNIDFKKYTKLIDEIKNAKIKYVGFKYDN